MDGETVLRIGELSRRSGVSPELLRAWERRYGLLRPTRSAGGLRLYSLDDLDRVQRMQQHLAAGLAAAEAASLASRPHAAAEPEHPPVDAEAARRELRAALDDFDEPGAQAVVDGLLTSAMLETVLTGVVLPYLRELGERWERGEASVAQEHFASNLLRGRLLALARGWGRGLGPLALLACPPGERHDLGLLAFGLVLRPRGWRIAYLGADTPLDTIETTAGSLEPDLVVLAAVVRDRIRPHATRLRRLGERHRLAVGGAGIAGELARDLGAIALPADPVAAADEMTALVQPAPAA